jgi:hypothetical protein
LLLFIGLAIYFVVKDSKDSKDSKQTDKSCVLDRDCENFKCQLEYETITRVFPLPKASNANGLKGNWELVGTPGSGCKGTFVYNDADPNDIEPLKFTITNQGSGYMSYVPYAAKLMFTVQPTQLPPQSLEVSFVLLEGKAKAKGKCLI